MNTEYLKKLLLELKNIMADNKNMLIELDSVVGDGDLGLTMSDGFRAAYENVAGCGEKDAGKLLYQAGKAMSTAVPSTMGTLMASGLMEAGKRLKGKEELTNANLTELFAAYEDGVQKRGKAKVGEKTFLDGLHPANEVMRVSADAGDTCHEMAEKAALAAEKGFEDTVGMLAVHGRAATRGEASRSLKDPGACVAMLIMQAFLKSTED